MDDLTSLISSSLEESSVSKKFLKHMDLENKITVAPKENNISKSIVSILVFLYKRQNYYEYPQLVQLE